MLSCATPGAVAAAFSAPVGTDGSALRFDTWQPEVMANITE
jgi:hypothetical protein